MNSRLTTEYIERLDDLYKKAVNKRSAVKALQLYKQLDCLYAEDLKRSETKRVFPEITVFFSTKFRSNSTNPYAMSSSNLIALLHKC